MSNPFIGEIRIFAGNYAPTNWAFCDGSLIPIVQNNNLYNIIGTIYGGDGKTNFALPNLVDRAPLHAGGSAGPGLTERPLGGEGGQATVTLDAPQIPLHTHAAQCSTGFANSPSGENNVWATGSGRRGVESYSPTPGATPLPLAPNALNRTGGTLPHNNLPPYLGLTFIIALNGVIPPHTTS